MKDPTELLNHIALKTMELKITSRAGGWSWRKELVLFPYPEARCPSCEGWVQTNRVWLVDERYAKLLYCWHRDGRIVDPSKEIVHPHVNIGKRICKGSNERYSDALFAGISEGNHYRHTEVFFWELGHDCPNVPKIHCEMCNSRFVNIGNYPYGETSRPLCSNRCSLVASMFRCYGCFAELPFYDEPIRDGYCETCYIERTSPCGLCDGRVFRDSIRSLPTGEIVCTICSPIHFSRCSYCQAEYHNSLLDEDGRCTRCTGRRNDTYYCACDCECGNEVDGEDSYCYDCDTGH